MYVAAAFCCMYLFCVDVAEVVVGDGDYNVASIIIIITKTVDSDDDDDIWTLVFGIIIAKIIFVCVYANSCKGWIKCDRVTSKAKKNMLTTLEKKI